MAKLELLKEPNIARYKELANCLDRLQNNPDWKEFMEKYLFTDFINLNTQNINEPLNDTMVMNVKYAVRNIQNINWFKSHINFVFDMASRTEKESKK